MTSVPALTISNLHVQFGGIKAIDGLSCTIEERTITGLIGPNGSGKTTLLNTITGMTEADTGSIVFHGHPIQGLKPHATALAGRSRSPGCFRK